MINFLRGKVHELTPTYAIIDVNGIGYYVGISLQTSQKLSQGNEAFLYTQQIFREDAQLLFGFSTPREKEVFNLLISVNGVGAVSALILLSSLDIPDIANAVLNNQSVILQKVKGIGAKTAERIIVDLRDKMLKFSDTTEDSLSFVDNKVKIGRAHV
jgi:Holliday junction DNA helicase RuvA